MKLSKPISLQARLNICCRLGMIATILINMTGASHGRVAITDGNGYPTIVFADGSPAPDGHTATIYGQGNMSLTGSVITTQNPLTPAAGDIEIKNGSTVVAYFDVSAGSIYLANGRTFETDADYSNIGTVAWELKDGGTRIAVIDTQGDMAIKGKLLTDKGVNHILGLKNPIFDPAGKTVFTPQGNVTLNANASLRDPTVYRDANGLFHILFTLITDHNNRYPSAADEEFDDRRIWEVAKITTWDFRDFANFSVIVQCENPSQSGSKPGRGFASPDKVFKYKDGSTDKWACFFQHYTPDDGTAFGGTGASRLQVMTTTNSLLVGWSKQDFPTTNNGGLTQDPDYPQSEIYDASANPSGIYQDYWGFSYAQTFGRKIDPAVYFDSSVKWVLAYKFFFDQQLALWKNNTIAFSSGLPTTFGGTGDWIDETRPRGFGSTDRNNSMLAADQRIYILNSEEPEFQDWLQLTGGLENSYIFHFEAVEQYIVFYTCGVSDPEGGEPLLKRGIYSAFTDDDNTDTDAWVGNANAATPTTIWDHDQLFTENTSWTVDGLTAPLMIHDNKQISINPVGTIELPLMVICHGEYLRQADLERGALAIGFYLETFTYGTSPNFYDEHAWMFEW